LISAPELSKHLITSQCPAIDARNNGDCPCLSHKLISAPELSKHLTTSQYPEIDAAKIAIVYSINVWTLYCC
jgi:hypothetical protein